MRTIKTVLGIFTKNTDTEQTIRELEKIGYHPEDFSLVMRDHKQAQEMRDTTGSDIIEGTASGAATGAVLGGLAGLLIGIGAITIPGVGAFLVGGPLAAALGLTGAAATTASGAATGALAGGLLGALMNLGLSRDEAETYERHIHEGRILLAVPVANGETREVIEIMEEHNGIDAKAIDITTQDERRGMHAHHHAA